MTENVSVGFGHAAAAQHRQTVSKRYMVNLCPAFLRFPIGLRHLMLFFFFSTFDIC